MTLRPRHRSALWLTSLLLACGDSGGASGSISDTSITSATATANATEGPTAGTSGAETGAPTTSGGSGGESSSSSDGVKLDLGVPDAGDGMMMGCKKVDILYVIDNSPSMYDEQQTLIANFDTFVQEMQAALAEVADYHIGVITTDNYAEEGFLDDSTDVVNASVPACKFLGGMVVESQQGLCTPFAAGFNYITEADVLEAKFSCVANVGEDGDSDERVGDALIGAIAPENQAPGTCNAGFLRPDALLILVILTDENDSSDTDPQEWYDAVVAAKGKPENVVALSLIWDDFENNCQQDLSESTGYTIEEFTQMFPNHAVGNICDYSYEGFFASAVPTIDTACDNLIPG